MAPDDDPNAGDVAGTATLDAIVQALKALMILQLLPAAQLPPVVQILGPRPTPKRAPRRNRQAKNPENSCSSMPQQTASFMNKHSTCSCPTVMKATGV